MNCKEIVVKYLKENDYDGLFNKQFECGCSIDNLFPCECTLEECVPVYFRNCATCELKDSEKGCHLNESKNEYDGCFSEIKPPK